MVTIKPAEWTKEDQAAFEKKKDAESKVQEENVKDLTEAVEVFGKKVDQGIN